MSFYANHSGWLIVGKGKSNRYIIDGKEFPALEDAIEYAGLSCLGTFPIESGYRIDIEGYEKYNEDLIYHVFEEIKKEVVTGEIRCHGEDDSDWRFRFLKGDFTEEAGKVVYNGPDITRAECEKALEAFRKLVENKRGIRIFVPENRMFYDLEFGTGDNLLPEDRAAGYNDYVEVYSKAFCGEELVDGNANGGEYLFDNSKINDKDYNICSFVFDAMRAVYEKDYCPMFVPISVI